MTAVETSAAPLAESGLVVKMEDRKRPASYESNESAPPSKKQAMSMNGGGKPHPDADMPWRDDLERFQKDAIMRQMQEYKREKSSLEARLKELSKNAAYHDDHLRIIDAWFKQLIDEVKVTLGELDKVPEDTTPFPSALLFSDNQNFEKHLKARSDDIKSTITRLFSQSPKASPEISELQGQLTKKLAEERVAITELEKALSEKQQLEERLEAASLRYMVAEKKIDRARSLTVAKLEKQHILGPHIKQGGDSPGSSKREDSAVPNGTGDAPERLLELEESNNKALAVSEQQKEQLEKLEAENSKLLAQVTELNVKFSKLSDEDYAQTDLFKQLKSQHEDVIKRINHLEAINVQLREEAEKLQAERTAYRIQVENEAQAAVSDKEAQLAKAETDLARIRNARDELLADQQMRKAAQEQERMSIQQNKELLEAREARISSLESELERVQLRIDGIKEPNANIESLSVEELRTKYQTLDRQYDLLNTELSSMQTAFKKTSKLASQKIADFTALEDKVQRLTAEKSKADQKYFAAMKSKEARESELRTLRIQNMKSSDIVTQLKDAESMTRTLVSNVEKQLSETREMLTNSANQYRNSQQQVVEANIVIDGLKSQVDELKSLMVTKDSSLASATSSCRKAENEIASLKSTLSDTKKSLESWRSKGLGNSSTEYEMLRTLALCTVCRRTFKNTVIKTCGHVFCRECVEERLTSRSRKCPNCNKSFGNNDYLHITL